MYRDFYIHKYSGTYAETLEAYGVANLANEVLDRLNIRGRKITIEDKGLYYQVNTNKEISDEQLNGLGYFQVVKFLKNKQESEIPDGILESDIFNYPVQKAEQDRYREQFKKIKEDKNLSEWQKKEARKELTQKKLSEFGSNLDVEYDVYRQLIVNPYTSYTNLHKNFYKNREFFSILIKEVFAHYAQIPTSRRKFKLVDETPTAQQIFNPNQGKGLNKNKANNVSMSNINSSWVTETMKISGALRMMSVQYVKVGTSYDLKIYVPEFRNVQLSKGIEIFTEFKRYLKSSDPIKLDILNVLDFICRFIERSLDYQGKIRNAVQGFHMAYQKDLGQNRAVANISFISSPDFVEYTSKEEGKEWMNILKEQRDIISGINEMGDSILGLQHYRDFLGSTGKVALQYFSKFNFWYAPYLMQSLDDEKDYVKPFNIETLTKFYNNMESQERNLSAIIQNGGFQAVAKAIRKSTVSLQYTPKENRQFEIRYGLAQQLQNKSKSKEDLATFIGEFVGMYNAETARNKEKREGMALRANIKDEELNQFYAILDQNPSRLVGALLASFGFALEKKEAGKVESNEDLPEEIEN